jgi:hypothetical protein
MLEGSGSVHLTNGSGSRRSKNTRFLRIRIPNTGLACEIGYPVPRYFMSNFKWEFSSGYNFTSTVFTQQYCTPIAGYLHRLLSRDTQHSRTGSSLSISSFDTGTKLYVGYTRTQYNIQIETSLTVWLCERQHIFSITGLRIRIHMIFGLLDPGPDPLVRGMNPDLAPDPSIIKQKL